MTLHAFLQQQYDAMRSGKGIAWLSGWTNLTIAGSDRQKFLNSFCTNDVQRLAPGEGCEAFITSVKGKVLGHGFVQCRGDALVLITVPGQAPPLIAHLDRYIIREDVQLLDKSADRAFFCAGPGVPRSFDVDVQRIVWNWLGSDAVSLMECAAPDIAYLQQSFAKEGCLPCDHDAVEALRIETGTPLFGIDFDEQNLPQEIGRDREAISFTKGCYLGQETVARIDALGHVNQQIVRVRFSNDVIPNRGDKLMLGGETAGQVTSAVYSPSLNAPLALAMLRRHACVPGTKLQSTSGPCEVVAMSD